MINRIEERNCRKLGEFMELIVGELEFRIYLGFLLLLN